MMMKRKRRRRKMKRRRKNRRTCRRPLERERIWRAHHPSCRPSRTKRQSMMLAVFSAYERAWGRLGRCWRA
jgi:hypothetical protein